MKVGVAILARYNSRRLPGKALMDVCGKPLLARTYESVRAASTEIEVAVATSDQDSDLPIVQYCTNHGIACFRGDLDNVAKRFSDCGGQFAWDFIIRINGDNLFVDSSAFNLLVDEALTGSFDLLSNVPGRTFPYGMSIEIVRSTFFRKCIEQFENEQHREHVTAWLYEHEEIGRRYLLRNTAVPKASSLRLAVDTEDDLNRSIYMIEQLGENCTNATLEQIVQVYRQWLLHQQSISS